MVQPPTHGRSYVLVFGIGNTSQRDQLIPRCIFDPQCGKHVLDVDNTRQQPACFDAADLALAHATTPGEPVTGQARCLPQVVQSARQVLAILPGTSGIELHLARFASYSLNGWACDNASRFHLT